jgi:hypothetical protein
MVDPDLSTLLVILDFGWSLVVWAFASYIVDHVVCYLISALRYLRVITLTCCNVTCPLQLLEGAQDVVQSETLRGVRQYAE